MENAVKVKEPWEVPFSHWFMAVEGARLKHLKPEPTVLDGSTFGYYVGAHRIRLYPECTAVLYTVDGAGEAREYVAESPTMLRTMLEIVDRLGLGKHYPSENTMLELVHYVMETQG